MGNGEEVQPEEVKKKKEGFAKQRARILFVVYDFLRRI
jgi:hypothetical protein